MGIRQVSGCPSQEADGCARNQALLYVQICVDVGYL